jgi:hypothetical protein
MYIAAYLRGGGLAFAGGGVGKIIASQRAALARFCACHDGFAFYRRVELFRCRAKEGI